jgi:hypothetical protein
MIEERIEKLVDLVAIQCSSGNWNFDPYMHGMANGMILALSIIQDEEPQFLSAPDKWLSDISIKGDTIEDTTSNG